MPVSRFPRLSPFASLGCRLGLVACALLAGCAHIPDTMPGLDRNLQFSPNDFDTAGMHTRHMAAPQASTCEAARRALLSQGYMVHVASSDTVAGRKYYQPHTDVHYVVEMRVVCASEGQGDVRTSAFASALQDRYVIKKINNSASLGVGGIGSVSLPVTAIDDTLVKVGSETIADPQFYERFFQLFEQFVRAAPVVPAAPTVAAKPALHEREAVPHAAVAATVAAQPPAAAAAATASPAAESSTPAPPIPAWEQPRTQASAQAPQPAPESQPAGASDGAPDGASDGAAPPGIQQLMAQ